MSEEAAEQIEAWRSVAAGWEARRPLFWAATRRLSERLVEMLDPQPGETVLELAAGPGDTGFLLAEQLGADGLLLSTDAAPEMVAAAERRGRELGVENVAFRVIDAAAIDLPDASVDAVVCRFGLMLVVDVEAAFSEVARVVRPGGRVAIATWAEPDANEWITAGGRAASELGLLEPAADDAPGPFRLHDVTRLRSLVSAAGLQLDALENVVVDWRAASLDEWWGTWRDTSRMLSVLEQRVDAGQLSRLRALAEQRLSRFRRPDGSVEVPGLARALAASRPR